MKSGRKIRAQRQFAASMHAQPYREPQPLLTDVVVSEAEVRAFIAHIAATGFYEDEHDHVQSATPDQRKAACDFIEHGDDSHTQFMGWARNQAQINLYGHLRGD